MVTEMRGETGEPKLKNYFPKNYSKTYFYNDIEDESSKDTTGERERENDLMVKKMRSAPEQ